MLPALDLPTGVPLSASALAARGSIAIASGRGGAARDFAAVASALAIAAFGAWLLAMRLPVFPAALAMVGMSASVMSWNRGLAWRPDALSPALALLAAWCVWRTLESRRRGYAAIAIVAGALAVSEDAAWLAVLPGVAVLIWQRFGPGQRARAIGIIAALVAAAAWPFVTRAIVARELPWAMLIGEAPPEALALWAQSVMALGAASPATLAADLAGQLTPLGLALAGIGTAVLFRSGPNRTATAILIAALLLWYGLAPRSRFEPIAVPLAIGAWAAVAIGLQWVHESAPPRAATALVAILGVALVAEPSLTRIRLATLGKDLPSELRGRMAADFRTTELSANVAIISESRRVDAAILMSSQRAGRPVMIVPQSIDRLQAVAALRPLIAFANARANLERFGFLFERDWTNDTPISMVAGHVPCIDLERGTWPDVSLHVAAGSLSIHGGTPGRAPGGVVLRVAAVEPLHVRAIEPRSIPFEITDGPRDPGVPGVPELERATSPDGVARVTTIRIAETGRIDPVTLTFDRAPHAAVATGEGPGPARLCAGVPAGDLWLGRAPNAAAALRMETAAAFGAGWHPLEADPDYFRWTAAPEASVLVTAAHPTPVQVMVTATPAARPAQKPSLSLSVNACRLPSQAMTPGQGDYEWQVPEACWRPGFNQVRIGTSPLVSPALLFGSHDTRLLGARIGAIRFARLPR